MQINAENPDSWNISIYPTNKKIYSHFDGLEQEQFPFHIAVGGNVYFCTQFKMSHTAKLSTQTRTAIKVQ